MHRFREAVRMLKELDDKEHADTRHLGDEQILDSAGKKISI